MRVGLEVPEAEEVLEMGLGGHDCMSYTKGQRGDQSAEAQVKACSCGDFWKEAEAEQNSFLRLQDSGDLAGGLGSGVCRGISG